MIKEHLEVFKKIKNNNTYISEDSVVSEKAIILQNTIILGCSIIKDFAIIGPNSIIYNSIIETKAEVISSCVFNSFVGKNACVGPFAHLRNKANVADESRIGNFVEIKNSELGYKTKASHLSYIGDALIGESVNIGCGAITVNFDGKVKHQTRIGDNAFIGCNVNLVAPVSIGKSAVIACGSTITKDIEESSLAIARCREIEKKNYYL